MSYNILCSMFIRSEYSRCGNLAVHFVCVCVYGISSQTLSCSAVPFSFIQCLILSNTLFFPFFSLLSLPDSSLLISIYRSFDVVASFAIRIYAMWTMYVLRWSQHHMFTPPLFHFKCNLPTIIYSNVLHSKYFSP